MDLTGYMHKNTLPRYIEHLECSAVLLHDLHTSYFIRYHLKRNLDESKVSMLNKEKYIMVSNSVNDEKTDKLTHFSRYCTIKIRNR